ncbi:MAG TPA: TolC family protein [Polyangiaceae bacterium]|jgi:cobalt-zinc-cadmium efflux system outer membrane protein|nr:TolC family protein [Polyangiaceae bacterium]
MERAARPAAALFLIVFTAAGARAANVTYAEALAAARRGSGDLAAARALEDVARADIGIAGVYPNPSVSVGTSTQTARFSGGVSVPLVILGQRGAAVTASKADLVTSRIATEIAWSDVRAATARAFVALWLAAKSAAARADAATVAARLDDAVKGRVEVGAAPELEGLRAHAERLRADADAREAAELVGAAGSDLGRWMGLPDGAELRASGDPDVPAATPVVGELAPRVDANPAVRRERADAQAAEARADRERALVRPALALDLGVDIGDPTLPATNYRAQLGIEVPVFNQRGPYVEHELAAARAARFRANAERIRLSAALAVAYRQFVAVSTRRDALASGVVPAAESAAQATEAAYTLGRLPLVAVLDAERARIDARLSLLEAEASRANAWVDVQYALGAP